MLFLEDPALLLGDERWIGVAREWQIGVDEVALARRQQRADGLVVEQGEPPLVHADLRLPSVDEQGAGGEEAIEEGAAVVHLVHEESAEDERAPRLDRKSTRLNSSDA